jgi:hypothetical protein
VSGLKIFTILVGMRFPVLMKLTFRHGISILPKYLLRYLILFHNSLISSALTLAERYNYRKKIAETEISLPPVFIIGHWRSGTTYLHQLFHLDPGFTTPTMVQTVIPDHFLFSTKYYVPILRRALPHTRPMDNVKMGVFEPQEEEFALIRMGSASPIERIIFPRKGKFFLEGFENFIPRGKILELWKKNLLEFYRKITLLTGKRIISKNPAHTMRISLLAEMFPGARFVHIVRDPMTVVPSAKRLWNIMWAENGLKRGWKAPETGEVASMLGSFLEYVSLESRKLDDKQFSEVRFEDLEKDPMQELERIYSDLDLPLGNEFRANVMQFLKENSDYRKNTYELSEEEREIIRSALQNASVRDGYGRSDRNGPE